MSQDSTQGLAPAANLATRPIEQEFHPGWTITIREHQPIELSDHTHICAGSPSTSKKLVKRRHWASSCAPARSASTSSC